MTYSFIIPHHNNPDLLNRCLETIPQRADIEIIVVDDNSHPSKRPDIKRNDVKIFYIDEEHHTGPGGARNLGIEHASGKWILFTDCDDYYVEGFIDIIDKFKDSNMEMIFFGVEFDKRRGSHGYIDAINKYIKRPTQYNLITVKHILQGPINFMVLRALVFESGIRFGQGYIGEDALFHHKIAMKAKLCTVIPDMIYVVTYSEGSLTSKKFDKQFLINTLLPRKIEIIGLKIAAQAWATIPPFYHEFKDNVKRYGVIASLEYAFKMFVFVPWHKVYWHKILSLIHSK